MKVEIWPSCREVGKRAAGIIRRTLKHNPCAVFALPTGTTPLTMYAQLAAWHARGQLDARRARFFGLDEFVGLDPRHPASFHHYLQVHLWDPLELEGSRCDLPRGSEDDLPGECLRYDRAIAEAGGIDLAVVGIGVNGHVGFNEPGTDPTLGTHVVELTEVTRRAQAPWFGGQVEQVPRQAITVGIRTIREARAVVLLACGASKARVIARALHGPPDPTLPASLLRLHPRLTVILDQAAATLLWPKQYRPRRPADDRARPPRS